MLINAYKSKYTGKEIEALFDKLNAIEDGTDTEDNTDIPVLEEGHCYSTAITTMHGAIVPSNYITNPKIETNFGFIQYTGNIGTSTNLLSLLTTDAVAGFGTKNISIIYTFKKPVTLLKYRYKGNSYFYGININLYYEIDNEWVLQGNYSLADIGVINLDSQITTEKAKIEITNGNSNACIYYSIFDFISDEYIVSGPTIKSMEE